MQPNTIFTADDIVNCGLAILRKSGRASLTVNNICQEMGISDAEAYPVLRSDDSLVAAVKAASRRLYNKRIEEGFNCNPPFKGFGLALLSFSIDEPELFKLIMEGDSNMSFHRFIDENVGFRDRCISIICKTFPVSEEGANEIYYQMITIGLGIAFTSISRGGHLNIDQAGEMLSMQIRALLTEIKAKESRAMLNNPAIGQSRLVGELHKNPRYIRDDEWEELERIMYYTSKTTPETLRLSHPDLTTNDIRQIILNCFDFTTGESSVLLGICPASVTKARQRLKAKLQA